VACRLCEAKGKPECEFLYGIEKIQKEDAYDFAFERFQKPFLIDCSKDLSWVENFIDCRTFNKRIIHLLRDPRAWFASEKRRNPNFGVEEAAARWVDKNSALDFGIKEISLPYIDVFYDELCLNPDFYFNAGLSDYLGIPYERDALEYWKFEASWGEGGYSR